MSGYVKYVRTPRMSCPPAPVPAPLGSDRGWAGWLSGASFGKRGGGEEVKVLLHCGQARMKRSFFLLLPFGLGFGMFEPTLTVMGYACMLIYLRCGACLYLSSTCVYIWPTYTTERAHESGRSPCCSQSCVKKGGGGERGKGR